MSFIFSGSEDPKQALLRKNKAVMDALQAGATQPATDLGSGLSSLGSALAYRAAQERQTQAAADPWAGMRETTPAGPFAALRGLFGG